MGTGNQLSTLKDMCTCTSCFALVVNMKKQSLFYTSVGFYGSLNIEQNI